MRWYRGDCHIHSRVSTGGELTPRQLVDAARAAGLDFITVTEHNTTETLGAFAASAGGGPLVVPGEEVTTDGGHWLAVGGVGPRPLTCRCHRQHGPSPDEVRRAGGLCVAAHPHAPYPTGTFRHDLAGFDAVEIWNGAWTSDVPWQADNARALAGWAAALPADLRTGRWRPAVGGSDTHLAGQLGVPQLVVRAAALQVAPIVAAIRAGHSWIAGSADVSLHLTAEAGTRRAGIGDHLRTGGDEVWVTLGIQGVPDGVVSFHTGHGPAHETSARGPVVRWRTTAAGGFVRVEVRHPDGTPAALTNPVLLD